MSVSNDDGLYVRNDRKSDGGRKQEHKTTGTMSALVEESTATVIGGPGEEGGVARGDKGRRDIVLESSSRISLKVGGSFVVIHSGAWTSSGRKISLNSGGKSGTPVPALQLAVLKTLGDEKSGDGSDSGEETNSGGTA